MFKIDVIVPYVCQLFWKFLMQSKRPDLDFTIISWFSSKHFTVYIQFETLLVKSFPKKIDNRGKCYF